MADVVVQTENYKLRAGAPMAIGTGTFVMHTFMAEMTTTDVYLYTEILPDSNEFLGRGGEFIQANFTRMLNKNNESYTGSKVHQPVYVDEEFIV